ncbi:hypothetical protein a10_09140 [Streptomyces acidiscabies]|nr:hypothetical protein a10_09140 [Streptomyces acidiscabies]
MAPAPSVRRSRPTSACNAPCASAGGSPAHTSSTSEPTDTVRPARNTNTVNNARNRAPPTANAVSSGRRTWVAPRTR